jgi:MoxR-like ATPase
MSLTAKAAESRRLGLLVELQHTVQAALEGKPETVDLAIIALLARGHVLIEDVPGVGKTTLARAIARAVGSSRTCC